MWNTAVNRFKHSPQRQGKTEKKKKSRTRKVRVTTALNARQNCESPSGLEVLMVHNKVQVLEVENTVAVCIRATSFAASVPDRRQECPGSDLALQIFNFLVEEPCQSVSGKSSIEKEASLRHRCLDARPRESADGSKIA